MLAYCSEVHRVCFVVVVVVSSCARGDPISNCRLSSDSMDSPRPCGNLREALCEKYGVPGNAIDQAALICRECNAYIRGRDTKHEPDCLLAELCESECLTLYDLHLDRERYAQKLNLDQRNASRLERRFPLQARDEKQPWPLADANIWSIVFSFAVADSMASIGRISQTCRLFQRILDEFAVVQKLYIRAPGSNSISSGNIRFKTEPLFYLVDPKFRPVHTLTIDAASRINHLSAGFVAQMPRLTALNCTGTGGSSSQDASYVTACELWKFFKASDCETLKLKRLRLQNVDLSVLWSRFSFLWEETETLSLIDPFRNPHAIKIGELGWKDLIGRPCLKELCLELPDEAPVWKYWSSAISRLHLTIQRVGNKKTLQDFYYAGETFSTDWTTASALPPTGVAAKHVILYLNTFQSNNEIEQWMAELPHCEWLQLTGVRATQLNLPPRLKRLSLQLESGKAFFPYFADLPQLVEEVSIRGTVDAAKACQVLKAFPKLKRVVCAPGTMLELEHPDWTVDIEESAAIASCDGLDDFLRVKHKSLFG